MFLRNYVPCVVKCLCGSGGCCQADQWPPGGSVVGVVGSWQEAGVRGSPGGGDRGCWIPMAKHDGELDCCFSPGLPGATGFEQ